MTNQEFSNEFDILYNNITSNQAPGLDEYEKSVFLTKAQDEIIKNYFNPKGNKYQEGFDDSEKRQIDFSMIMRTQIINGVTENGSFDSRSKIVDLPDDILMILNEFAVVTRAASTTTSGATDQEVRLAVIPLEYREYSRLISKPYKRPLKFQAWRLLSGDNDSKHAEVIVGPNDTIKTYNIRYIKKPRAIILSKLEGVTLDNKTEEQSCELDSILHPEILQRAVELAKAAYTGDVSTSVELGKRSE
jgi:hypothetical protein